MKKTEAAGVLAGSVCNASRVKASELYALFCCRGLALRDPKGACGGCAGLRPAPMGPMTLVGLSSHQPQCGHGCPPLRRGARHGVRAQCSIRGLGTCEPPGPRQGTDPRGRQAPHTVAHCRRGCPPSHWQWGCGFEFLAVAQCLQWKATSSLNCRNDHQRASPLQATATSAGSGCIDLTISLPA